MATKKAVSKAVRKPKKKVPPPKFTVRGPCCSTALDLILENDLFTAEIDGQTFENVKTISLKAAQPMTVVGLESRYLDVSVKPFRVYISKGKKGETLVIDEGQITPEVKKKSKKVTKS